MEQVKRFLRKRMEEYNQILVQDILAYWLEKADGKSGGFYTCYNVFGDRLVSRDKYVWSQGRCVWLYSKLAADQTILMDEAMRLRCRELAVRGCAFVEKHCMLPNGRAAFVLDENNRVKLTESYEGESASTFADCFVAMGFTAAGILKGDPEKVKSAYRLLTEAARQMGAGTFQTAPDVLPHGWRSQAVYMIMIHTAYETAKGLRAFGMIQEEENARRICSYAMEVVVNAFLTEDSILLECLDHQLRPLDTLYGRHINPGHTEECMWFLIEAARWLDRPEVEKRALGVIKHVADIAWDERYGGMFYYLDRNGKKPWGTYDEAERPLAEAAMRDWDNKMWWPHLETIYAALMGYIYYGDEACLKEYERYHQYAFRVFPNPDRQVGEWIQIRDRQGRPLGDEVGGRLPVKDPYHLIRTLMLLQNLIQDGEKIGARAGVLACL